MIPDFKTFLRESVWSDMEDRGTGSTIKKEDDIELLDGEGIVDYLNKRYTNRSVYQIFIDINKVVTIPVAYYGGRYVFIRYYSYDHTVTVSAELPGILKPLFEKLCNEYQVTKQRDNTNMTDCYKVESKSMSKPSNSFLIEVIDFMLDNVSLNTRRLTKKHLDKKVKKLKESIWSDMEDRGYGEATKKEDEIGNLKELKPVDIGLSVLWADDDFKFPDQEKFTYHEVEEYIKDTEWRLPTSEEAWELINAEYDSHFEYIIYKGNGNSITFNGQGYIEKGSDSVLGPSNYFCWTSTPVKLWSGMICLVASGMGRGVSEKSKDDRLCIRLVKDKKTNESVWSDMEDRGSGEVRKKEDEVNLMDGEQFCNYLKSRYDVDNSKNIYNPVDIKFTSNTQGGFIDIPLFLQDSRRKTEWYQDHASFLYYPNHAVGFGCSAVFLDKYISQKLCDRFITPENGIIYKDRYFKSGHITNELVIEMIDFVIDTINENPQPKKTLKPAYPFLIRKNGLRESIWTDMEDRGTGEIVKKEDEINHLDGPGFLEYLKDYYNIQDESWTLQYTEYSDTVSIRTFSSPWVPKKGSYMSYVNTTGFKNGERVMKVDNDIFKHKGLNNLRKALRERYTFKKTDMGTMVFPIDGSPITNQAVIDLIDCIMNNLDPGFEVHIPKIVKESVWDDMQDRGTGDVIKTEDDVNHLDFQDLAKYIENNYKISDEDAVSIISSKGNIRGISVLIMRLKDSLSNDFYIEYSSEYGDNQGDLDVVVPANIIDILRSLFNKVRCRYSMEHIDRNTMFGSMGFVRIIPNDGKVDNRFFLEILDFITNNTTSYIKRK